MTTPTTTAQTLLSDQVAAEIRAVMGRQDINKAELARLLGVNEMWIGRRLAGKLAIDLNDLARIANALGVAVVDLIPRTDGNSPTLRYRTNYERPRKRRAVPLPLHRSPVVGRPANEPHQPNGRPQPDLSPQPLRRPAIRRRRAMV